jgi:dolichol kinase
MNPRIRRILAHILFLINVGLGFSHYLVKLYINIVGAIFIPLLIFGIPGYLYYQYSCKILDQDESDKNYHKIPSLIFAIIGVLIVASFFSIELYKFAFEVLY